MQVVFNHLWLCFQSCCRNGQTYLRGLLECKDFVIRTVNVQESSCVKNVVFYYKMRSKFTKIKQLKFGEGDRQRKIHHCQMTRQGLK